MFKHIGFRLGGILFLAVAIIYTLGVAHFGNIFLIAFYVVGMAVLLAYTAIEQWWDETQKKYDEAVKRQKQSIKLTPEELEGEEVK